MKAENNPRVFQVVEAKCDQCLLSPDRIVGRDRVAEILKACRADGTHFICHKATLAGGLNVCCRAFYDTQDTIVIRMAKALGLVRFVKVEN